MKKILAICVVLVMMFSLGVTAFAAPNGFVSSPSGNQAPEVDSFNPADKDCDAEIVITPYGDREELPKDLLEAIEAAFKELSEAKDLTALNKALAKLAEQKGIKASNLLVSDLFDIHATGCDKHDGHYDFEVTLKADTLENFVALLHRKDNGEWELISNATVVNNGKALRFIVDSFSPFAVVVNKAPTSPQTSDNSVVYVCVILAAVAALAVIVISKKNKQTA